MYSILIAVLIAALDQLIKYNIVKYLKPIQSLKVIDGFLSLTYVENFGIAFGMFKNKALFFIIMTIIISLVVVYLIFTIGKQKLLINICLVLILGGAFGNLIDRIRFGYVIDYIHFSFFPPVFNFADSCIVIGAIVLSLIILLDKSINI